MFNKPTRLMNGALLTYGGGCIVVFDFDYGERVARHVVETDNR